MDFSICPDIYHLRARHGSRFRCLADVCSLSTLPPATCLCAETILLYAVYHLCGWHQLRSSCYFLANTIHRCVSVRSTSDRYQLLSNRSVHNHWCHPVGIASIDLQEMGDLCHDFLLCVANSRQVTCECLSINSIPTDKRIGCACLVPIDGNDIRTAFAPVVLALIGVGGVLVPNQVIITVITPDDLIASVTALTVGLRAQSQVIGLALFYSRFVSEVTKNAYGTIVPAVVELGVFNIHTIENFVRGLTAQPIREWVPLIPALADPANVELVRQAAVACFMKSLDSVYLITIAFGVTACIASLCIGSVAEYLDNHVAVVL